MEQAAATLKLAVAADNAGQYTQAMGLYLAGIDALLPVVRAEQDTTRKAGMSARLQTYVSRAEEIKQLATPVPPPQAAPPPPTSFDTVARTAAGCGLVGGAAAVLVGGPILTVASLGAGAGVHAAQRGDELGQAGRYVGSQALSGAAALQDANRRHNLTGKTASAAQAGWEQAKVLDGQYDLRGKASRMASATMNAAQAGWHMLSSKETASRSVHEQTK